MNLEKLFIGGLFSILSIVSVQNAFSQQTDPRIYEIIEKVSSERIEHVIRKLAGFGTRNTFSDTISETRGIGAARRWIKSEF